MKIDTKQRTFCGPNERNRNKVHVVVQNNGRSPGGGYHLQVELQVSPNESAASGKKYRKMIPAPGTGKTACCDV